jgi:hypothetical protein
MRVTQHNIEIMLHRMQVAAAWQPDSWSRNGIENAQFKCYLRHQKDLPRVREWIQESCGQDAHFSYVLADICRRDLDIEIEGHALSAIKQDTHGH